MQHRHPRLLGIPGVFMLRIIHTQLSVLNTELFVQDVVFASLVSFEVGGQPQGILTASLIRQRTVTLRLDLQRSNVCLWVTKDKASRRSAGPAGRS